MTGRPPGSAATGLRVQRRVRRAGSFHPNHAAERVCPMPMIVNTAWLLEYLEPKCSHEDLLDAFPRLGLEVEQTHELKKELDSIRIGFVRRKEPVAGAPGYHLCEIELERGRMIPVVCASEHEIREGWGVPVAPAGTVLATGRSIKAAPFHGVRSEGMICLDGELGMVARNSGMHYFTDESLLGAPLAAAVDVPEYLLELNVLPNRPDFLGLIGIAREVAALLRLELRLPGPLAKSAETSGAPAGHRGDSRARAMPALYVWTRPWGEGRRLHRRGSRHGCSWPECDRSTMSSISQTTSFTSGASLFTRLTSRRSRAPGSSSGAWPKARHWSS